MISIPSPKSHTGCSRCERLPDLIPEKGTLYLAPPVIHTSNEIVNYLKQMNMNFETLYEGIFTTRFEREQLNRLCNDFLVNISELELRDTKSLILADGEELTFHNLTQMQPLQSIVARVQGKWLFDTLEENRIVTYFHPIVEADNPSSVFAYECLARGKTEEGELINPGKMFDIAVKADLLFNLDRACRLAAITGCVRHNIKKNIFINFAPGTIYNPEYCLQTTMKAIRNAGISPEQIIFEVVETERITNVNHLLTILDYYRKNGFKVALDDLGAGYSSLNLLNKLKPDFVKLDMELIRNVDEDPYKAVITENIINMARKLGAKTITEGVETIGEWRWVKNNGADYVQGFLFARPAAPPEKVRIPE